MSYLFRQKQTFPERKNRMIVVLKLNKTESYIFVTSF